MPTSVRHLVTAITAGVVALAAPSAPALAQTVDISTLPGTLLIASTYESGVISERIDRFQLYSLIAGSETKVDFPNSGLGSVSAALSPDGTQLLVDIGGQVVDQVDLTGASDPIQVGERLPPLSVQQTDSYVNVAWSPDMSSVLVVRPFPVGMQVQSVAGGAPMALPYVGNRPAYSPDGARVAFSGVAPGAGVSTILVGPSDGSASASPLTGDSVYETVPGWLPDGSGVAYGAAGDSGWEVRLWDLASGTQSTLASLPGKTAVDDVIASPDGQWIAYTVYDPSTARRWVRVTSRADASQWAELANDGTYSDRVLAWVAGQS